MIACDLGSNTIRFVEIDCESKRRVREFEKIVRTAEDLKRSGLISDGARKRIFEAIRDARDIFDFSKGVKAVTTEALRVAKNSDEFLKEIEEKFGIEFEIIDGEMEAYYTNVAVQNIIVTKSYILVDIGGGSTEVSFVDGDKMLTKSFDLGIVTIVDEASGGDLKEIIQKKVVGIKKSFLNQTKPKTLVATSGTPTNIVAYLNGMGYKDYDYKKINGKVLSLKEVQKVKYELLFMDKDERKKWVGVGKEDLIIAGIEIFEEILKTFDFRECVVVDDGLREGVAITKCNEKFKDK